MSEQFDRMLEMERREWNNNAYRIFPRVRPDATGHPRPYFARMVSFEFPGYTQIELHRDFGGTFLIIGSQGMEAYKDLNGDPPFAIDEEGNRGGYPALPSHGWRVKEARCDQTGGMCMVDVYTFENDYVLTLNEECAVLHERMYDWDEGGEDYVRVCDLTRSSMGGGV